MNMANKITMSRVVMIPVFLVFLLWGGAPQPMGRYIAVAVFIAASLTDMLDGYIARSRNLITNFGKFLDPLADKLLVAAALISMVEMGLLPAVAVIIIISREFIITGFRLIAMESNIVIAAGWWGKVKTTIQMVMIVVVLLWPEGMMYAVFGRPLILLALVLTIVSGADYIAKNIKVLKG